MMFLAIFFILILFSCALCLAMNGLLKRTAWYCGMFYDRNRYPYFPADIESLSIVTLGSSVGKCDFIYDKDVKGANWANRPQQPLDDFRLLKKFSPALRKGGVVVFAMMPFSSLKVNYGFSNTLKYAKILDLSELDQQYVAPVRRFVRFPLLQGMKPLRELVKMLLKNLGLKNKRFENLNLAAAEFDFEKDAQLWMNYWKSEFGITSFENELSVENANGRDEMVLLWRKILQYCQDQKYNPVFVYPPVHGSLRRMYTNRFVEIYIKDFLRHLGSDVRVYDYTMDEDFLSSVFYENSFLLNSYGAKKFTRRVLQDIMVNFNGNR